jgi:UDP-GlcNAc:undecaprenyl-phosphate GlcNAc-1-phosphate transferase
MAATFLAAKFTGLLSQDFETGASSPLWGSLFVGGGVIFLCGIWDDLSPLSARTKFLAQLVAAGAAVWSGVHLDRIALAGDHVLELGMLSIPMTVLWIVGITNAFNLIDGLDGLAAGLGSIAAVTCAVIFQYSGAIDDATVLFVLLGALLGFLPFNFHPAKIFLGDSGSLILGYLLAVMVITGTQKYATATAVIIPLLTLGVPIIDTLLSMVRRMFYGPDRAAGDRASWKSGILALKQVFMADRDHIHHRLMARGLSHRGAVLALYAAAAAMSSLAVVSVLAGYRNALLLLMTVAVATAIGIAKLGYLEIGVSRIGTALQLVDRPRFDRSFFFGFADLLLAALAYWGAYALLAGRDGVPSQLQWYLNMFPLVALVQLSIFWMAGLYRGLWRAVGVGDLMRVAIAVSTSGALAYSLVMVNQPPDGADSLFVVDTLALGWLMGGLRSAYRLVDHSQFYGVLAARPALIYGAGLGGRLVLRELRQNTARGFHAVGFVDDDCSLQGRLIGGIPVLGDGGQLESLLGGKQIQALIVSTNKIAGPVLQHVLRTCAGKGVSVFRSEYLFQPLAQAHAERRGSGPNMAGHDRSRELRRLRSAIASLRKTAM